MEPRRAGEPDLEAQPCHAAGVLHGPGEAVDTLLAAFAAEQRARGVRVRGLVQHDRLRESDGRKVMELVDVDTGQRFPISQDLGAGAASCNLDPAGIAAAAVVLRRALEEGAELVVVNRFGALEIERGGFAAELLELMASGTPSVMAVSERHLAGWQEFSEGRAAVLAPTPAALAAWARRVLDRACPNGETHAAECGRAGAAR